MRRTTKDPRTVMLRKVDRMVQDWYRENHPNGKCESCGKRFQLIHHFIEKSRSANLRFDTENFIFLCEKCHALHHKYGDSTVHARITLNRGKKWFKYIERKRRIHKQWTIKELRVEAEKWK